MSAERSKDSVDLLGFYKRREEILEVLEDTSRMIAIQITNLIPPELEGFRDEAFPNIPRTIEWLTVLKSNTDSGSCNSSKIKQPEVFGFENMEDAKVKFGLLKEAWKGIIDVKIIESDDNYIEVEFRVAH